MKLSIEDRQLPDELCRENNVSREKARGNALVSFELGVSYATVNRWEKGLSHPSKPARAQLDAFCERIGRLAGWTGRRCDTVFQFDFYRQGRRMSGRIAP